MLKTPGIINAPHATEVMLSLQEQEQVGNGFGTFRSLIYFISYEHVLEDFFPNPSQFSIVI